MLPYNKYWLQQEMHLIEAQSKNDRIKKKDTRIMVQWLVCLLLLFFSVANAQEFTIICPCCRAIMQCEVKHTDDYDYDMAVKSGTWTCPKSTCRYENDNRIRYCALCGTERQ